MHQKCSKLFFAPFLSLVILCTVAASAQVGPPDGGPPPDGPMQGKSPRQAAASELKNLTKKLKLSSPQKDSVGPILEEEYHQMNALFQDRSGSMEETMQRIKAVHDKANNMIRALLTEDQKLQFDKIVRKEGPPGGELPDGPPGEPPPGSGPPQAGANFVPAFRAKSQVLFGRPRKPFFAGVNGIDIKCTVTRQNRVLQPFKLTTNT